jgi:hypothetical protein
LFDLFAYTSAPGFVILALPLLSGHKSKAHAGRGAPPLHIAIALSQQMIEGMAQRGKAKPQPLFIVGVSAREQLANWGFPPDY